MCALTDLPLNFHTKHKNASLDRIDNTKGYTIDNIQWVHKDINWMKGTFTQDQFIELCGSVGNYQGVKMPAYGMLVTTAIGDAIGSAFEGIPTQDIPL